MTLKMKVPFVLSTGLVTIALSIGAAHAAYPQKPIQLIVPWSAGGGTDAIARTLAIELQEHLGQPVNVVNRSGAGGIVGHTAIAMAKPDGYTVGLTTAEISTYRHIGTSNVSYEDMTPIGMLNFDAAAFSVNADSEWDSLDKALADIKANPGQYTISGTGPGAAYHLALSGFLNQQGIDPNSVSLVPSEGAAPAFQELAAGGVDIVYSSLPETDSMSKAGRINTLAVFSDERLDAFPEVPTAKELTGQAWISGTWRGLTGPGGIPDDIAAILSEATHKAWQSERFQSFMDKRGFGTEWRGSKEFGKLMAESDKEKGVIIDKLGLAE